MTVTKVGGANMIAHAQCPLCPPFPRVAVFYVTPDQYHLLPILHTRMPFIHWLYFIRQYTGQIISFQMMSPLQEVSMMWTEESEAKRKLTTLGL